MPHIEFTRQSRDDLSFYFRDWQPETPSKAVVCLVHGLGEHTGRYAHVAAALNDAGYAVLGFDLRGHGKSGGRRGHISSYDALIADIGRLLDEAAARYPGLPRFLYGHSLGGSLVLNFALRRRNLSSSPGVEDPGADHTVAGMIATSPFLRTAFTPPPVKLALGKLLYSLYPAFLLSNGLERAALSRDPEVVRAYGSDPLVHDRMSARLGLEMLQAGERALARAEEFPPLPLLLVHGTADRLTSAKATQEFATKVPGDCTLKLWEGFYHETHNEPEKSDVLGFMVDWLQRRERCPTT